MRACPKPRAARRHGARRPVIISGWSSPALASAPAFCGALLVALIATVAQASAADATCYSSTPGGIALGDSPNDAAGGLAPEIKIVIASVNTECRYSVDPGIPEPLKAGDSVFEYVNVDGNPATGSRVRRCRCRRPLTRG